MNFVKSLAWFIGGLVGTMLLINMISNHFIFSFFIALVLAYLGGKDGQ